MNVLELGARYGTCSVCLDYILNEPKKNNYYVLTQIIKLKIV